MHKKSKRKVLKKQARKARAQHLIKCASSRGRNRRKGNKPLTELYVKGNFTEDREEWQQELQRHCEEVYTDEEETNEIQEDRIELVQKEK